MELVLYPTVPQRSAGADTNRTVAASTLFNSHILENSTSITLHRIFLRSAYRRYMCVAMYISNAQIFLTTPFHISAFSN